MPTGKYLRRTLIIAAGLLFVMSFGFWSQVVSGGSREDHLRFVVLQGDSQLLEKQPSYDTSGYDRLLHTYVTDNGWVDYAGLARERGTLNQFLQQLATVNPSKFKDNSERLAFWINAYNAFTLADVLDTVYGKYQGVRQVSGFFDGRRHLVAREQLTLDEIEKRGRQMHDPRIHFAIVCASTSCPKLQRFAYTGEKLDSQLEQSAREFLADPHRGLRFDTKDSELYLSPIFKWYAGDFTGASGAAGSLWARVKATVSGSELLNFIVRYAPPEAARQIREHPPIVRYFDYDWSLNALDTHAPGTKP
jgi:Protein of unknown function, DUF547